MRKSSRPLAALAIFLTAVVFTPPAATAQAPSGAAVAPSGVEAEADRLFNLVMSPLAWVVPATVFTFTGIGLVLWLRRARPRGADEDTGARAPAPTEMESRLDDELADLN